MTILDGLPDIRRWLERSQLVRLEGRVAKVAGLVVEVTGLPVPVGTLCNVRSGGKNYPAEVIGFSEGRARLMALHEIEGLAPGDPVAPQSGAVTAPVGYEVLGRVLNGYGEPMDGKGPLIPSARVPVLRAPPTPMERQLIQHPLTTGVRALDGLTTFGCGQRVGIFAGSGVGKSMLLGEIVRNSDAEVAVIGLIGERGREVREFLEHTLGPEGLAKSVIVAATSDTPPLQRLRGAYVATAIAEWYRDQGKNVLLVMDSVTRFAFAVREIGLAAGEPPTTRGYPPSLYTQLPKLVERMGTGAQGSITALLTVLVEGDDLQDPVADVVRGLLDGHVVLSRRMADRAHYPAIDVLASVSRVFNQVTTPEHRAAAQRLREQLSVYETSRDLIEVGAYRAGTNPVLDLAIKNRPAVLRFLQQQSGETTPLAQSIDSLTALAAAAGAPA
ncbi:MAG: FliI/YscN family ATPase [Planctomycetota bacterium]